MGSGSRGGASEAAWPVSIEGNKKKTFAHRFFLILTTTRLVLLPPFPFFPSSPHSITASPPIDNFSLRCSGACQFPLPSSSFSPASAFVPSRSLEQRLLIRSETAFCHLSVPHRQIVARRRPVPRFGIVLFSYPVRNAPSSFISDGYEITSIYIYPAVCSSELTHRHTTSARSRLATKSTTASRARTSASCHAIPSCCIHSSRPCDFD